MKNLDFDWEELCVEADRLDLQELTEHFYAVKEQLKAEDPEFGEIYDRFVQKPEIERKARSRALFLLG